MEFELTKPRETFHFISLLSIEGSWMLGLTSLDVYNSVFNITQENRKFVFYTDTLDEFPFEELKSEFEEIVNFSIVSNEHLQDEEKRPRIIPAFKKLETEKKRTDGYYMLLMG